MTHIKAKEILLSHAEKNKDGFMAGQIKWILQAMEEYAGYCKVVNALSKEDFTLKIYMKDHVWDGMTDNILTKVNEFEKQLNVGLYDKFLNFLNTNNVEIKSN